MLAHKHKKKKLVKGAYSAIHCVSAQTISNVSSVVESDPVLSRLKMFWQNWASLGSNPWVDVILKEGHILFQNQVGWVVNLRRLYPKQIFNFVGY